MGIKQILLQIGVTTDVSTTLNSNENISILNLIYQGGFVMIPIFILSIISVYVFIERLLYIKGAGKLDSTFLNKINVKLKNGQISEAIEHCENQSTAIGRILNKGIIRIGGPIRDVESAMETTAGIEIAKMEKNLNLLLTIAAIAPMTGFLGTVTGMIRAFYNISIASDISIGIIAGGIYEKMVTSASGLIVGIMAYIFYTWLNSFIDKTIIQIETASLNFTDLLYKPVYEV